MTEIQDIICAATFRVLVVAHRTSGGLLLNDGGCQERAGGGCHMYPTRHLVVKSGAKRWKKLIRFLPLAVSTTEIRLSACQQMTS